MKMEELNKRRASFLVSPPDDVQNSPHPSTKEETSLSRENSLRVAVQHRRASIISMKPDSRESKDRLDVEARSRSGSFRSDSREHLLMVSILYVRRTLKQTERLGPSILLEI